MHAARDGKRATLGARVARQLRARVRCSGTEEKKCAVVVCARRVLIAGWSVWDRKKRQNEYEAAHTYQEVGL